MCQFDVLKRFKVHIICLVSGAVLLLAGSLLIAVGASHDDKEVWGWGIVLNIFGLVSAIFGMFVICVVFHPSYGKAEETWTVPKAQMFRGAPFSQMMNPPSNFGRPNAIIAQDEMARMQQEPPQGYPGNYLHAQPQPSYTSTTSSYAYQADKAPIVGQGPGPSRGPGPHPQQPYPKQAYPQQAYPQQVNTQPPYYPQQPQTKASLGPMMI